MQSEKSTPLSLAHPNADARAAEQPPCVRSPAAVHDSQLSDDARAAGKRLSPSPHRRAHGTAANPAPTREQDAAAASHSRRWWPSRGDTAHSAAGPSPASAPAPRVAPWPCLLYADGAAPAASPSMTVHARDGVRRENAGDDDGDDGNENVGSRHDGHLRRAPRPRRGTQPSRQHLAQSAERRDAERLRVSPTAVSRFSSAEHAPRSTAAPVAAAASERAVDHEDEGGDYHRGAAVSHERERTQPASAAVEPHATTTTSARDTRTSSGRENPLDVDNTPYERDDSSGRTSNQTTDARDDSGDGRRRDGGRGGHRRSVAGRRRRHRHAAGALSTDALYQSQLQLPVLFSLRLRKFWRPRSVSPSPTVSSHSSPTSTTTTTAAATAAAAVAAAHVDVGNSRDGGSFRASQSSRRPPPIVTDKSLTSPPSSSSGGAASREAPLRWLPSLLSPLHPSSPTMLRLRRRSRQAQAYRQQQQQQQQAAFRDSGRLGSPPPPSSSFSSLPTRHRAGSKASDSHRRGALFSIRFPILGGHAPPTRHRRHEHVSDDTEEEEEEVRRRVSVHGSSGASGSHVYSSRSSSSRSTSYSGSYTSTSRTHSRSSSPGWEAERARAESHPFSASGTHADHSGSHDRRDAAVVGEEGGGGAEGEGAARRLPVHASQRLTSPPGAGSSQTSGLAHTLVVSVRSGDFSRRSSAVRVARASHAAADSGDSDDGMETTLVRSGGGVIVDHAHASSASWSAATSFTVPSGALPLDGGRPGLSGSETRPRTGAPRAGTPVTGGLRHRQPHARAAPAQLLSPTPSHLQASSLAASLAATPWPSRSTSVINPPLDRTAPPRHSATPKERSYVAVSTASSLPMDGVRRQSSSRATAEPSLLLRSAGASLSRTEANEAFLVQLQPLSTGTPSLHPLDGGPRGASEHGSGDEGGSSPGEMAECLWEPVRQVSRSSGTGDADGSPRMTHTPPPPPTVSAPSSTLQSTETSAPTSVSRRRKADDTHHGEEDNAAPCISFSESVRRRVSDSLGSSSRSFSTRTLHSRQTTGLPASAVHASQRTGSGLEQPDWQLASPPRLTDPTAPSPPLALPVSPARATAAPLDVSGPEPRATGGGALLLSSSSLSLLTGLSAGDHSIPSSQQPVPRSSAGPLQVPRPSQESSGTAPITQKMPVPAQQAANHASSHVGAVRTSFSPSLSVTCALTSPPPFATHARPTAVLSPPLRPQPLAGAGIDNVGSAGRAGESASEDVRSASSFASDTNTFFLDVKSCSSFGAEPPTGAPLLHPLHTPVPFRDVMRRRAARQRDASATESFASASLSQTSVTLAACHGETLGGVRAAGPLAREDGTGVARTRHGLRHRGLSGDKNGRPTGPHGDCGDPPPPVGSRRTRHQRRHRRRRHSPTQGQHIAEGKQIDAGVSGSAAARTRPHTTRRRSDSSSSSASFSSAEDAASSDEYFLFNVKLHHVLVTFVVVLTILSFVLNGILTRDCAVARTRRFCYSSEPPTRKLDPSRGNFAELERAVRVHYVRVADDHDEDSGYNRSHHRYHVDDNAAAAADGLLPPLPSPRFQPLMSNAGGIPQVELNGDEMERRLYGRPRVKARLAPSTTARVGDTAAAAAATAAAAAAAAVPGDLKQANAVMGESPAVPGDGTTPQRTRGDGRAAYQPSPAYAQLIARRRAMRYIAPPQRSYRDDADYTGVDWLELTSFLAAPRAGEDVTQPPAWEQLSSKRLGLPDPVEDKDNDNDDDDDDDDRNDEENNEHARKDDGGAVVEGGGDRGAGRGTDKEARTRARRFVRRRLLQLLEADDNTFLYLNSKDAFLHNQQVKRKAAVHGLRQRIHAHHRRSGDGNLSAFAARQQQQQQQHAAPLPPRTPLRTRVAFVTAVNRSMPFTCLAQASAVLSDLPVHYLNFRRPYNHLGRFDKYMEFIEKEELADDDVLVAWDSDVIFTGESPIPFLQEYIYASPRHLGEVDAVGVRSGRLAPPIIFAGEKFCMASQLFRREPDCKVMYNGYEQRLVEEAAAYGYRYMHNRDGVRNPFRYLNGGVLVGRVWAIRKLQEALRAFTRIRRPRYRASFWFCDQTALSTLFVDLLNWELDQSLLLWTKLEHEVGHLLPQDGRKGPRGAAQPGEAAAATRAADEKTAFADVARGAAPTLSPEEEEKSLSILQKLRSVFASSLLQPYGIPAGFIGLETSAGFGFATGAPTAYKEDFFSVDYMSNPCLRCTRRYRSDDGSESVASLTGAEAAATTAAAVLASPSAPQLPPPQLPIRRQALSSLRALEPSLAARRAASVPFWQGRREAVGESGPVTDAYLPPPRMSRGFWRERLWHSLQRRRRRTAPAQLSATSPSTTSWGVSLASVVQSAAQPLFTLLVAEPLYFFTGFASISLSNLLSPDSAPAEAVTNADDAGTTARITAAVAATATAAAATAAGDPEGGDTHGADGDDAVIDGDGHLLLFGSRPRLRRPGAAAVAAASTIPVASTASSGFSVAWLARELRRLRGARQHVDTRPRVLHGTTFEREDRALEALTGLRGVRETAAGTILAPPLVELQPYPPAYVMRFSAVPDLLADEAEAGGAADSARPRTSCAVPRPARGLALLLRNELAMPFFPRSADGELAAEANLLPHRAAPSPPGGAKTRAGLASHRGRGPVGDDADAMEMENEQRWKVLHRLEDEVLCDNGTLQARTARGIGELLARMNALAHTSRPSDPAPPSVEEEIAAAAAYFADHPEDVLPAYLLLALPSSALALATGVDASADELRHRTHFLREYDSPTRWWLTITRQTRHPVAMHYSGGWKEHSYNRNKFFSSWFLPVRHSPVGYRRAREVLEAARLSTWEWEREVQYRYTDFCGIPL